MMSEEQSPARLTPEDLLPAVESTGPVGPREKRARDMATMVALMGLVLVAGGLMAILALVFNQLLIFAFLAAIVLGGGYLSFHYVVWGRRLDRQLATRPDPPSSPLDSSPQPPLQQDDRATEDPPAEP
jgi:hypothetical protein